MKPIHPIIFLYIAITGLMLSACHSEYMRQYQILTFEGCTWAGNISNSYVSFGSTSQSEESMVVKMVASPGDLLYILTADDTPFYLKYLDEGPTNYLVTLKNDQEAVIYLNNQPVAFRLTPDPETWNNFAEMDPSFISGLSYLEIPDQFGEEQLSILEKFESDYSGIGLVLGAIDRSEILSGLFSILKPTWIVFDDSSPGPVSEEAAKGLLTLEMLFIEGKSLSATDMLNFCPNLKQLIISEWSPDNHELLQLENLKQLNSLTMINCDFSDLSQCTFPGSLTRLHLIDCDTLTDISGLRKVRKLSSLSLSGCDNIIDITFLNNLPNLQFLSLPENIIQEEFILIMQEQKSLKAIEIIGCEKITDLSILREQSGLKALMINLSEINLSQLHALNNPDLIILNDILFEQNPRDVEELKMALPDSEIYPGNGLCLGSGWLLLILPVLFIMRYTGYLKRRLYH